MQLIRRDVAIPCMPRERRRSRTRSAAVVPWMEGLEERRLLALPAGWQSAGISHPSYGSVTGSANASNGVFTVSGNGFGYPFGFEYAYTNITGDFDAKMRVTNLTQYTAERSSVGLMVREGTNFFDRSAIDANWEYNVDRTFPLWFRMMRVGDVLTSYRSTDGQEWAPEGCTELRDLNETVKIGIAVTGGPVITATVDSFTINPLSLEYATSWVGNSFGSSTGFVQYGFDAIALGPNGTVVANCEYEEGGSALSIYGEVNGKPTKLSNKPGLDGLISGGYAVVTDSTRVYYGQYGSVRAASIDSTTGVFNWQYSGNPNWSYSGSSIHGLALYGGELYVADTGANKIVVLNPSTGAVIRQWSVTRPGPLAFDGNGNLWVIQVYARGSDGNAVDANGNSIFGTGSNEGDRVNAYTRGSGSTAGTLLAGKTISGTNMRPCALAYDAVNGRMLVADNGPDVQIKAFRNLGAAAGAPTIDTTFGTNGAFGYQGGVFAGPNPGAVNDPLAGGNARFYHLAGIAIDATGNLYVAMTWSGGEMRKFRPDGTMAWAIHGLNFVQTASVDPISDPTSNIVEVYTNREHFTVDLSKPVSEQSTLTGYTWAHYTPAALADGVNQYSPGDSDSVMVRIEGEKFLFIGGTRVYRFDGDIAIPCANIWPGNHVSGGSYWRDANADGIQQSSENTSFGSAIPAEISEQSVDTAGNIWFTAGNKIYFNRMIGLDANGIPQYAPDTAGTVAPAPLGSVGALTYDPATDTMYLGGTSVEFPSVANYPPSGAVRIVVQYKNWRAGNRAATNTIVLPADVSVGVDGGGFSLYKLIVAMDVVGQYIFAQTPFSEHGSGQVFVYDKDRGNLVTVLTPGPEVGSRIGNTDNGCKVHAYKMASGMYLVFSEDDGYNKTVMYEWTPTASQAAPTVSPVIRSAVLPNKVTLEWETPKSFALTGYNLYRSTAAGGVFTKLNTSGVLNYNTYTDSTVIPGVTYYYKIAAVNSVGEGVLSPATVITPNIAGATNIGIDATTLGNWTGAYGSQGYVIFGDKTSLPGWAKLLLTSYNGNSATTTTDANDLLKTGSTTSRVFAPIWTGDTTTPMGIDLSFTDGLTHKVSFYVRTGHPNGVGDLFRVINAATGTVLTEQVVSTNNTAAGYYVTFNIAGHVKVNVYTDGFQAAISGIFIDPAASVSTAPFVDGLKDRSLTDAARSTSSWGTATPSLYWQFDGDMSRVYTSSSSAQYLTWNVAGASSFAAVIFYHRGYMSDPSGSLALLTSPNGTTWTAQTMTHTTGVSVSSNWSTMTYSNLSLPVGTNYVRFRMTVSVNDSIELGKVTIDRPANTGPTVSQAAAASPAVTSAAQSSLSVLGADDNGESGLIYSWAAVGMTPAEVSFSANGTNAAKNTVATFAMAGAYNLQVTITDPAGRSVTSSATVQVTALPNQVAGLTATTVSSSQIDLSWAALSGATSYNVYRSTTPGGEGITPIATGITSTSYSNTGLAAGTTYYYKVDAVTASGTGAQSAEASATTPLAAVPAPWSTGDVGSVGIAGSAGYGAGSYTLVGSGTDIWDTADAFRYVYQPLSGNGQIVARVASLVAAHVWAKSGVMIRESLTTGSAHASMLVTPGNGLAFQYCATTGGGSSSVGGASATAPMWVKLVRQGDTFTSYSSPDGNTWTTIGSANITMGTNVYIGLAVTSHDNAASATSTIDSVSVTTSAAAAPSGLVATATSASQINLTWTDNSSNETGFKIERATNSGFTQNLTLLTTTAAGVTSYSTTLAANATYYYRAAATNAVGDSANSNTALALGAGSYTFASDLGLDTPQLSLALADGAQVVFNGAQHLGSLSLAGSAKVTLADGGQSMLVVRGLALDATSSLDVADNAVIVDYSGSNPFGGIYSLVAGSAANHWVGNGIVSHTAAGGGSEYAIGVADNGVANLASFAGQTVDATSVLIRFTYSGDANLDGQVDLTDLSILAGSWQMPGRQWGQGDYDYSGSVDLTDLSLLASNWQKVLPAPAPAPAPVAAEVVSLSSDAAAAPEPVDASTTASEAVVDPAPATTVSEAVVVDPAPAEVVPTQPSSGVIDSAAAVESSETTVASVRRAPMAAPAAAGSVLIGRAGRNPLRAAAKPAGVSQATAASRSGGVFSNRPLPAASVLAPWPITSQGARTLLGGDRPGIDDRVDILARDARSRGGR